VQYLENRPSLERTTLSVAVTVCGLNAGNTENSGFVTRECYRFIFRGLQ
jgi:hypothetical protein